MKTSVVTIMLILCCSFSFADSPKLTSLCGFDFAHMNWDKFNDRAVVDQLGPGCGSNENLSVFWQRVYQVAEGQWLIFDVIENDRWVTGIQYSNHGQCKAELPQKPPVRRCQTNEGLTLGDSEQKLIDTYGVGRVESGKRVYWYAESAADVEVENGQITSIKVYSLVP